MGDFGMQDVYTLHIKRQKGPNRIISPNCESCQKGFIHVNTLQVRQFTQSGKLSGVCRACNAHFLKICRSELKTLIPKSPYHKCDVCGKEYYTTGIYVKHRQMHEAFGHSKTPETMTTDELENGNGCKTQKRNIGTHSHRCETDELENGNGCKTQKRNIETHSHRCEICCRSFTTANDYHQHKQMHERILRDHLEVIHSINQRVDNKEVDIESEIPMQKKAASVNTRPQLTDISANSADIEVIDVSDETKNNVCKAKNINLRTKIKIVDIMEFEESKIEDVKTEISATVHQCKDIDPFHDEDQSANVEVCGNTGSKEYNAKSVTPETKVKNSLIELKESKIEDAKADILNSENECKDIDFDPFGGAADFEANDSKDDIKTEDSDEKIMALELEGKNCEDLIQLEESKHEQHLRTEILDTENESKDIQEIDPLNYEEIIDADVKISCNDFTIIDIGNETKNVEIDRETEVIEEISTELLLLEDRNPGEKPKDKLPFRQDPSYVCTTCKKVFKKHITYISHCETHKTSSLACPICDMPFNNKAFFKIHFEQCASRQPVYICDVCKIGFKSKSSLKNHLQTHATELERNICKQTFMIAERHLLEHVGGGSNSEMGEDGERTSFKRYIDNPGKKLNHFCYECGKGFVYWDDLRNHVGRHDKDVPFECPTCKKLFIHPYRFVHHFKFCSNTDDLPIYPCNFCSKTFNYSTSLKRHSTQVHKRKRKELV